MERQWHEVLILNDEGDRSFVKGAPLLMEALSLVASTRALPLSLNVAFYESELSHINDSHHVYRTAREELQELHKMLASHLESVFSSMSSLISTDVVDIQHSQQESYSSPLLRCHDGLVMPHGMILDDFLLLQPVFNYKTFRAQFGRLCHVVASGSLFSACEPRIKVLQGRYRLYRAFNGSREDGFHPTLGGGCLDRAPQLDVRRIGSCMSANTLLEFMQHMLVNEPNIVLPTRSALSPVTTSVESVSTGQNGYKRKPNKSKSFGDEKKESDPTLKEVVDSFFGAFLPTEERYFTPDGLGLLPNYTETIQRSLGGFDSYNTMQSEKTYGLPLLQHFLDICSGNKGELLARLVMPMLSKVVKKENHIIELEFTINGRLSGEVQYIASWCVRSGLIALGKTQFSLRVVQKPLRSEDIDCTAKTMEDVLTNIFSPIWLALLQPKKYPDMLQFLGHFASVVVAVSGNADVQELPDVSDTIKYSAENGMSPPDAFFIYHIWRNVQLLNCTVTSHVFFAPMKDAVSATMTEEDSITSRYFLPERSLFLQHTPIILRPILFRLYLSATSKNSFAESVMGLLVADEVVNPLDVFNWSPLAYLYYLTQRSIILNLSQIYNAPRDSALRKAVPFVVETGLHAFIVSLDPLHYHTSDDALHEELNGLQKEYQLSIADITELCLHSVEHANWGARKRRYVLGEPWGRVRARFNEFTKTQVSSLRLHFRESSLAHEMDLLCRKGLSEKSGFVVMNKEQQAQMTVMLGPTLQQSVLNDSSWPLTGRPSLAVQRETLWRFFSIPHNSALEKVGLGIKQRHFIDRQIVYPRIVISGPNATVKKDVSHKVAKAFERRQYYMGFSVHYEPPPLSEHLPISEAVRSSFLTSQCAENIPGGKTSIKRESSLYYCSASLMEKEQKICIPNKFCVRDGVWDVMIPADANDATRTYFRRLPTWDEFQCDVRRLRGVAAERTMQLYAKKRLEMLECKFNLHVALTNDDRDHSAGKKALVREWGDLYKCIKVDVHCHMAAGMTARELLSLIKYKVQTHAGDLVDVEHGTGRFITLGEMFKKLQTSNTQGVTLNVEELTVASLRVKAGKDTFNRFDEFNGRYSPLGYSALRSLLLKTDNFMGGRYFAELIGNTFRRQAEDGCSFSEYRLSIYGRRRDEWDRLSRWVVQHRMIHPTNRWMVQVPRLYFIYRNNGTISSFEEFLSNIFVPLWEASINPEAHPFLSYFLTHISGFDSVDNESERETDVLVHTLPSKWTSTENPPFSYWVYYMWVNITALNRYRAARGLSTFTFRPHAGESGDPDHMADVFFVADGVNHGINLKDSPVLQYLYYLAQIPLGITPLSNNALFCKYHANPFSTFFRRGLNVSLGTDGALTFHYTEQPLIEEYSTAANFWDLSLADVCEIAKNSVLMSGFPSYQKKAWLGDLYALRSAAGNDVRLSRVPHTRCTFRYELYLEELNYLKEKTAMDLSVKSVIDAQIEGLYTMDIVGLTREEVIERRLRAQPVVATHRTEKVHDGHTVAAKTDHCITAHSQL